LQFTGQAAGAVGSAKEGVAKLGRAIYSATPEQLIQMANGISNTKIASMLRNVASQPEKKRKALLFTMIQNPAYREAIGALDPE
jgi:hypothetical protein